MRNKIRIIIKVLLTSIILFLASFTSVNAAEYIDVADDSHKVFTEALAKPVSDYLDSVGNKADSIDLNYLREVTLTSILENGGWGGDKSIGQSLWDNLAYFKGGKLVIGCGNEDLLEFNIGTGGGGGGGGCSSKETVIGTGCSKYISSWDENWSNCNINSNWDSNGKITCKQINTWSPHYTNCGQKIKKTNLDGTTTVYCDTSNCLSDTPKPNNQSENKEVYIELNNPKSFCTSGYANNSDECSLQVDISGITNQNKPIVGLSGKNIKNFKDFSNQLSDRVNNSGLDKALNFAGVMTTNIKGSGTDFYFTIDNIRAVAPFHATDAKIKFSIEGINSFTQLILNNIFYNFKKPFKGNLEIDGDDFKIGTEQTLKLNINRKDDINGTDNCPLCSYKIENFIDSLKSININYNIFNKNSENNLDLNPILNFTLNYTKDNPIGTTGVSVNPYITYNLDGKEVRYVLSETNNPEDISAIQLGGATFVGVKIVGALQGQGKQTITNQEENFSNLDKSSIERDLKKNVYMQIKSMSSNQILNGVKFVLGDTMISGDNLGYETLIIKDGNLTIYGDTLNSIGNKLGIILIKTDSGDKTKGNIYIKPEVRYINAIIYADGAIISVDNSANLYSGDSAQRTKDLQNQLVIKGTIFTENTIGGAILGNNNKFILPGGEITTNFDEAMKYDLNYIRRGNNGWDGNDSNGDGNNYNEGYSDPFVIIYNPLVQSNPPKLFTK